MDLNFYDKIENLKLAQQNPANFKICFTDTHTNLIKVSWATLTYTPFQLTNGAIHKLTGQFFQIGTEVLGSINELTTSHEEIISSINVDQLSFVSTQISSISNSERINSSTRE